MFFVMDDVGLGEAMIVPKKSLKLPEKHP